MAEAIAKARDCGSCPLRMMPFVGPQVIDQSSNYVVLGEAGGKDEASVGLPFVGRSGRLLHEGLDQLPYQPLMVWNMVPRAIHKGNVHLLGRKTTAPTTKEIEACWNCQLGSLLNELKPHTIVAVGSTASTFLCGVGVELGHGSSFPLLPQLSSSPSAAVPVFIIRHPAGVLRNLPRLLPQLESDLTALEAVLLQRQLLGRSGYVYGATSTAPPTTTAAAVMHSIGYHTGSPLAVDLETTSLDSNSGSILGVAMCAEPGIATYTSESETLWNFIFQNSNPVFHNGVGFDMEWVPEQYRYAEVDDTLLMARVLGKPYGTLKDLAAYEYGLQHENIRLMLRRTGGTLTDDSDELAAKSCEDVDLTLRLFQLYDQQLQSDGLSHIYTLERMLAPFIRQVHHNGMLLDKELGAVQLVDATSATAAAVTAVQQLAPLRRLSRVVTTTWKHLFGPLLQRHPGYGRPRMLQEWREPVNPNSPQQLVGALLEVGVQLSERTPTGDYALTGAILEQIDHPLAAVIRRFRKQDKIRQFVAALMDMGGTFYPVFKQMGAASGRLSSGGDNEDA